jgi:hypothetical protein
MSRLQFALRLHTPEGQVQFKTRRADPIEPFRATSNSPKSVDSFRERRLPRLIRPQAGFATFRMARDRLIADRKACRATEAS